MTYKFAQLGLTLILPSSQMISFYDFLLVKDLIQAHLQYPVCKTMVALGCSPTRQHGVDPQEWKRCQIRLVYMHYLIHNVIHICVKLLHHKLYSVLFCLFIFQLDVVQHNWVCF